MGSFGRKRRHRIGRWPGLDGRAGTAAAGCLLFVLSLGAPGNAADTPDGVLAPEPAPAAPGQDERTPIRDPFAPGDGRYGSLYPPSVDPGQLNLQAILYHPGESRALISGHVVGEGDQFFDYTVSSIQPGQVSLKRGKNSYHLFLVLSHESR